MEGPSLFLLQKELVFLINQKVIDVYGNAAWDKEILRKRKIYDVYVYGKRLIIQFKYHAVIIHFLMYGTYRINQPRENMAPRLALITASGSFYAYNCSAKCIEESDFKSTLDFDFDILSPSWNIKEVVRSIKKHPRKTIDDILLDQTIFTGVGNIIKNESLFLSKMLPLKKVAALSDKKLMLLAMKARDFSLNFVKWRSNFELLKHLQIYRKSNCPVCGTQVIRKKTGAHQRISFWCPVCQK